MEASLRHKIKACMCRAAIRHRGSSLRPRSSQQLQPVPTVPPAVPPTDPVTTMLSLPPVDFAPLGILATPKWPPGVQAGQPFTLTLELRNEGKAPQSLLVAVGDAPGFVVAGTSTGCSMRCYGGCITDPRRRGGSKGAQKGVFLMI